MPDSDPRKFHTPGRIIRHPFADQLPFVLEA